jgi:hypothetical protein
MDKELKFRPKISRRASTQNWDWDSFILKNKYDYMDESKDTSMILDEQFKFSPKINEGSVDILIDKG